MLDRRRIEAIVLSAVSRMNLLREESKWISESADALLDVVGGVLDSLDVMTLLIEVEDGLREEGVQMQLADVRTLGHNPYPLRSVATLVDYIQRRCASDWS